MSRDTAAPEKSLVRTVHRVLLGFMIVVSLVLLILWRTDNPRLERVRMSLFDAVAVSGTASMFLTPVIVMTLLGNRAVAQWAYLVSFFAAILGAVAYFMRGHATVASLLVEGHKYEQLLQICVVVLVIGFGAVIVGSSRRVEA